jgi:type IV pilus assembly protein PilX
MYKMPKKMNHNTPAYKKHAERGSVLPISLFILLVLTIIGATSLNDTVMEEKMSSNFQGGNLAFQAAESSINRTYINVSASTELAIQALDAWDTAKNNNTTAEWPSGGESLDLNSPDSNISTTLTAEVQADPERKVNLQGCTISVGVSTTCSALVLDVVGTGQLTGTNIQRIHTQGVRKPLPPGS